MKMTKQLEQQRQGALAQGQCRLGQARAETHQLGHVLLHPCLNVIPADEVPEPSFTVFRRGDVGRQLLGQVRDPVRERVPEGHREAREDKYRPHRHHGDSQAPPPDPPALQGHHERVQDHGDEGRHDDQKDDVLEPVDDLPE
jgi:hypothetical protein